MEKSWQIRQIGKLPSLKAPVMLEGLPGIGNVGKVSVDFIIDEIGAKKLYEISSYSFPHSVFINEDNLVELPVIEVFYKKFDGKRSDLLLVAGDVQPIDEASSYEFSEKLLEILERFHGQDIITLGGIGLSEYRPGWVNDRLYGVVGPIVGVSGLLLGLAQRHNMQAVSFLAETYGHPLYLGIKGAKELLRVLNENLKLRININKLDQEIKDVESEIIRKTEQLNEVSRAAALSKLRKRIGGETDYIG
ncbi:PAC2 family protein [Candidatus Woesearchaeota archaeon]|nr:PAC2 family protein [Candidatus Woesearchaeota archaeon]